MAKEITKGAKQFGINVDVTRVETFELDFKKADGIAIGSTTYFSNVAWQIKKRIDESSILFWKSRKLRDKVSRCFASS